MSGMKYSFTDDQVAQVRRSVLPRLFAEGVRTGPVPSYATPDPKNVQGDVYTAFSKGDEDFIFFTIVDKAQFKTWLGTYSPTSSYEVAEDLQRIYDAKFNNRGRVKFAQTQIAFSRAGLDFLGETGKIGDFYFDRHSMRKDKEFLTDARQWDAVFDKGSLHGVIIVAADSRTTCHAKVRELQGQIGSFVMDMVTYHGRERPGQYKGHEHFGYKDGISQPALRGLTDRTDIPEIMWRDPGVIVMGYPGDPNFDGKDTSLAKRPEWTKDGSLMVFRKLEQDVPEFTKYVIDNGKRWREFIPQEHKDKVLTDTEGAFLFGAQIFGRWKSGAPLQDFPIKDDPDAAKDPKRNNNFDYSIPGSSKPSNLRCPFTSHVRKMNPRQLDPYLQREYINRSSVIRSSITYGPEVTEEERKNWKTSDDPEMKRGLLFVCYQSSLANGFIEQTGFGGNDFFPPTDLMPRRHGQDPIIGAPASRPVINVSIKGMDGREDIDLIGEGELKDTAFAPGSTAKQEFFVTSRGGEYLFVPSLSTLKRLASI